MKKQFIHLFLILFTVMGFSQTIERIEAEKFNQASGARAETNASLSGGGNVGYIKNNTWIKFNAVNFTEFVTRFDIAAAGATGGTIEMRLGSDTGTLIGTATVSGSTSFTDYKKFSVAIQPTTGTYDLVFLFKHPTNTGYLFNLDYFEKVTDNPNAVTHKLTTSVSPSSAGTITLNPAGTTFIKGTEVKLTANKNFGYNFKHWVDDKGAVVSTANPLTYTINADATLIAEYDAVSTYTLTVNTNGAFGLGDYTIAPAGKDGAFSVYENGTNVTITAVENDIVKFSNWSDGSTSLNTSVVMNQNQTVIGTFANQTFIAGWTFKTDQYANPRVAELYSKIENRPQLMAYNVADNVLAPNVRLQNRGGKNGFCVWNTERGNFYYFMTTLSTVGYKNINVASGLLGYYYGADEWTFQYSLDGVNFVNVSALTTINTNTITSIGGILPAEAEGKEKIYLRWFPNINGPKHGSAVDVTATIISNLMIKADEVLVVDTNAPVLESSFPAELASSVGANGNIILNYNEQVKFGAGQAVLNGKNLTAEFINKTVKFSYFGLEYNKQYTFTIPAGFIKDLSGNDGPALSLSFKTMEKPVPVKRNFDLIVDANATDEQVASKKYVKTIAEAFNLAPNNSASRFLVLITNGTYNLGGDGTNPQDIVLKLPSGKNNVSLIAQSKDKVILQGNPGWGIKNAVLSIEANDLYMENVTIEHKDGITTSGQRPALNPAGDRNVYNGVRLRSKQDTQVTGGKRSFYYKSTIEGDVDFICGGGTHWFEECKLVSVASGYIVAPNHDAATQYGYIFNNNTITAATSYYLGRPWQNSPRAVYLNTKMINEPNVLGWANMGTYPALFAEYNSVNGNGIAVNTDNRTNTFTVDGVSKTGNYNPVLTKAQADEFTIENVLSGTDKWDPRTIVEQVTKPSNLVVSEKNTLKWDENKYAMCYVISKEGKIIAITTDALYADTDTKAGTYNYTIQSANEYGGLSDVSSISMTIGGAIKSSIAYFNSIDGTTIAGLTPVEYTEGTALTLPVPTLNGYTFYGWSVAATTPNSLKEITATTTGNQTLYAFWGTAGNNKPDEVKPPTNFDYDFTAAVNKSWDNAGNFNPAEMPAAGKTVSCTKEIETTATVFPADMTFSGAGTLRLRGAHKSTGNLTFKEGTRVYYNTSGAGMTLEAPMIISGNVKFEMISGIANQTIMTLSGPISGNGIVSPLNTGQGVNANTGTLLLKGDNSEFIGTWDVTQKSTKFPALNYPTVIEGASANAFGSGTIKVGQDNYIIFSHERAAGSSLNLIMTENGKASLNTILNVQKLTINGVEFKEGTYDKTTNPEFFIGEGKIEVKKEATGGGTETIPAFPGAEGYGKYVTGGRGGKVIYVTNLNDSGAGSLREAINQAGPRIVVFKVSGNIALKSELNITDNITIAGQTAPGGGITLKDYNVKVRGNNVILRYLRFRMGDTHDVENDALGGRFQKNIIVDHCSMSWSTDECVSFYQNENFTLQWCIISESLRNSVHAKGAHGYGGVWGGKNASFHHNLLAHHDSRNPRLGEYANDIFAKTDLVDIRNNVIYNWGGNSCYGGDAMNVNLVNNYWKPGPGTSNSTKERILSTGRSLDTTSPLYGVWGKYFVDGNYVVGSERATQDNWTYGVYSQFHGSQLPVSDADKAAIKLNAPHAPGEITTHSAAKAYELVLDNAGANLFRDAVDKRAVDDTRSGTASIMNGGNGSTNGYIDTPSATGGWPVLPTGTAPVDTDGDGMPDTWETEKGLNPASAADGNLKTVDGIYTNIEVYINSLVNHITAVQNGSLDVYVNPQNFVEKYNAAEDGSKFIMASGTYTTSAALAVKNHKYTFVPDENAKPVFAGSFSSDQAEIFSGSFSFSGVDFDLTNTYSNVFQFKNGSGVSAFEIKNASIKGIKQSLFATEGASDHPISKIILENCIVDGTASESASFIQPDSHIVNTISIKNSTVFNYKKGNSFIMLQKKDAVNESLNVTIENNTIHNSGSQDGFVFINNQYSNTSTYTFKNNIMQDERENPKPIFMFNSNHASGAGKAVLDNNLLVGVTSQVVKGTVTVTETNIKTINNLGLLSLSFPNPVTGDFSFSKNSTLAKASLEGGVIGDPRWLKADAKFSLINYMNSIDGKAITLSPSEFMEGAVTNLPTPKLEGYTFFGWSVSTTTPGLLKTIPATATGNQTFYAFWGEGGNNKPDPKPAVKSGVTYMNSIDGKALSGLTPVEYTEGTALTLPIPTLKDYTFYGWSASATTPNSIKEIAITATGNQTFYAFWGVDGNNKKDEVIPPTFYSISYLNLPSGAVNPNKTSVQTGTAFVLEEAQATGYRFLGWYADALYGKEVTGFGTTQKENATVYGRWKKLGEFLVFPTIASGKITLRSSTELDRLAIFSMNGLLVKQIDVIGSETDISISDLASGSYFIKSLKTGETARIIVK
ncbi:pectinesterase family protein [Flavobacterium phragmitis]|uniref:Listeria/Bacterioides repeat-containing protein n=1 Tax=Flavobacterium phragmitis TaxID=739143 RepID=A0A1I1U6U5_9FLAO|nr:pectinesterase family protein [Flavobacterium phragmitis]SFD66552.1 Listeria/Bacterioides repeat-containing protein [Flavobacterium phragmitis]